ncbi:hypothetical protein M3226_17930 [Neobacillus cucumis]|uniref:hypothetical protein n=1 Tax=Neobacillus cucumis TaxID=1740721 RepID=UPI00203B2CE4|nr:hypothetical protein [Neobacillus cucumis]MCM3727558.1 hypothetical protein [Neobacillus cucumis]
MGLEKFSAALDLLKGFQVNLYVGEDIFKGKLIGVETDHVVLETEKKYIFYYNIDKIQAITKNTKQFQPEKATVEFQKTQSLMELLHSFQYSWVTILSINKQSFYGVLSEIDEDFVTLINGEERILIKVTHISNILKGFIKEKLMKKEQKKTESKNENKNQNKETKESNETKNSKETKESNETKNSKETKESNETKNSKETKQTNESKKKDDDGSSGKAPKEYTAETIKNTTGKSTTSEKKSKSTSNKQTEVEATDVMEPNYMKVWSNPIKTEPVIKDDQSSKVKMQSDEFEPIQVFNKEMKKQKNETIPTENKKDESTGSKSNDIKSNKNTEKTSRQTSAVSSSSSSKKEMKNEKPQETITVSKPVVTQYAAPKKSETTSNEQVNNDTKNVWKQKDQETRAFRFTGEPVPRNQERTFPFAGWPRSNQRSFRF